MTIRDSQGNLVRWFGTNTDITAQIAAEEQIRNLNSQLQERVAELEAIMQVLPVGVAVSPDGKTIYVANGRAGTLSVIDAATYKVVATVPVGKRPWGLAVSRDGKFVYTANGLSNDVTVVSTATNKIVAKISVGQRPWGIAVGW